MNTLDRPSTSAPAHASRYVVPFHSQPVRRKRPETYKDRSYYGGPSDECRHCGAVFWFQGRVKSASTVTQRRLVYNLCCRGGKIVLEPYKCPPPPLSDLLRFDGDNRAKRFLRQIRSYNSLFAFTSLGVVVDRSINNGTAPYVFKINGVVHHRIGSLLPSHGLRPQFAQLYIYDTEHEVQNRLGMFENEADVHDRPDPEVARLLLNMLDEHNSLVAAFRFAKERLDEAGNQKVTLRLLGCNTRHDAQYNLPANGEVAAIIVGDCSPSQFKYDVLVHAREGGLKHVSCLHPSYLALQYPLLFPYGDRGYHLGIKYSDVGGGDVSSRKYVTMLEFVRHRSHYRLNEPNPFTCYGRLSNQLAVDAYSTIEASRLQFIADHQKELCCESVQGIADAIGKGLTSADSVGGRVIVPASFTGGRRYHVMNYQDAMAICRVYGPPDLFVTFTCNPKWKEIVDALRFEPGQQPCDRSDIVMGDILIPSLMVGDCSHSLCVRVSRLWEFLDPQDDSRLLHTDLVLLDEEGNSIHAQIYPPLCQQFSALLDEGGVYNLKYFLVRKANRFYKPVENCSMISFTKWTTFEVVLQIPLLFQFAHVLGVVSVISHVSSLRTRGRQAEVMKRTVTISNARDTGPTVDVVLWGERATAFPAEQVHKDSGSSPQIIIFVGTLVRSYADNVSLSGGSSCKWYINAPVPEVNALRASFQSSFSPNLITAICKPTWINSAEPNHRPVIWDQGKVAAESTIVAVPEHKKLKDIKYLHPFENKLFVSLTCFLDYLLTLQQGKDQLPLELSNSQDDAYSVLDGSTNKTDKSVTGKRSRTSPSKKAAKKLFRDEVITDDDAAGSTDVDAA
ncbi:putative replication protein [Zea mays]|uniref:Putative replication protein n=1 Tax=Zea mays TaxID=4577 RepID=A0A1D6QGZ4_MAIZE|nr:putative replication protein [Zea mays]